MMDARALLRIWLTGTAILLGGFLLWTLAPVLLLAALLTVALGLLSALMIAIARRLEARRDSKDIGNRE
jgi:hypothetical protein